MTIFLDLDGTLTDIAARHHAVYRDCVLSFGGQPLAPTPYWTAKRAMVSWADLLGRSGVPASREPAWLVQFVERIELPDYLGLDTLFPSSLAAVEALHACDGLVLVSLRRRRAALLDQLDRLGLAGYFGSVLSAPGEGGGPGPGPVKALLIRRHAGTLSSPATVVGDTEEDVRAAKALGARSVAVTSGIRDRAHLAALDPDHLLDSIGRVPGLFEPAARPTHR